MTKITLNFRLLLFSETETKVYYVRKICLYFRNISGKVTSGVFCCSVNILFHSQTFLGIKLMISGVTAEEHHSYSSYGAGKKKKLPSWPKRFFRASGQELVTTSPTSAWCQQEKLSHMPGQPVERKPTLQHKYSTHIKTHISVESSLL